MEIQLKDFGEKQIWLTRFFCYGSFSADTFSLRLCPLSRIWGQKLQRIFCLQFEIPPCSTFGTSSHFPFPGKAMVDTHCFSYYYSLCYWVFYSPVFLYLVSLIRHCHCESKWYYISHPGGTSDGLSGPIATDAIPFGAVGRRFPSLL